MKIHHLNCATMRPFGGRLVSGTGSVFDRAESICHCLLIETDDGLVLVDSGLGTADVAHPAATLTRTWRALARPVLDESETAVRQVEQLGYAASDVRDIVLTHLDMDHGGGLPDFPDARVHVLSAELEAAQAATTRLENERYPHRQWAHGPKWVTHDGRGENWFGFRAVRDIAGLPPEILLVPLPGHTIGHTGVAVRDGDRWLLAAGDAYFHPAELQHSQDCPPLLRFMQWRTETVRGLRLANQERLRELVRTHGAEITVFSAHNPVELRALQQRAVSAAS